jgi:putative membrane protein
VPDATEPRTHDLKRQAAELKRSVSAVEKSTGALIDDSDRRTILASDRTLLAAERTYAAWVRTALAALASGVGARALMKGVLPGWVGKLSGSALVIFAGFCLVAAVWREVNVLPAPPRPDVRRLPILLLIPMNGFLLLVAIAALVGIWAS